MSKGTFYFKHECNARTDRKLVNLIRQHGMQGAGIYWCLVEMLYEEDGCLPLDYELITYELRADMDVVQSVINDFDLFKHDNEVFYSEAVLKQLKERCEKSEQARKAISCRWEKYLPQQM